MSVRRIFVEKRQGFFDIPAQQLHDDLVESFRLSGLKAVRLFNRYDIEGLSDEEYAQVKAVVFSEPPVDVVYEEELPTFPNSTMFAVEYLPGQYDQTADSAAQCVQLVTQKERPKIATARVVVLVGDVSAADVEKIKNYYINAVESREASMAKPETLDMNFQAPADVELLEGFTTMDEAALHAFMDARGFAMSFEDLKFCQEYFRDTEKRDPTITEIRVIDTYWSDHCRHTTFTTAVDLVDIEDGYYAEPIRKAYDQYLADRKDLYAGQNRDVTLMDLAVIGMKALRKQGKLEDLDKSEEINACSIVVNADIGGKNEEWLVMFKNETHNHPTEIEPFGGAATCLGGAIRDPLSGRSYVYQAMRVTGAGDIWKPVAETLPGKLPQRVITKKAAQGYSSYGNQIGLATTHVREIYDEGYTAKRLEVGAVVGAVKADHVRRESPKPGDVVLLLGGRTGRDGIGGATGSSKEHTEESLETCGSEVQKGNAPEERKLQRLFRRPEVTELIKKSNDFGAGGVSVAIGELTDGLDIYLDRVPVKYNGLNATELAISESQERMSVVVEAKDEAKFMEYCHSENVEVTHVADVTDTERMRMFYGDKVVADLQRKFIDSAGAKHYAKAQIAAVEEKNPFTREVKGETLKEKLLNNLSDANVVSQKGLIEMFDSTIGRSTVLMPYGGELQLTETQVSVQKLPTDGYTDTASMMAFGFNPVISKWSPYHGAAYSMIEACAKVVAAGGRYEKMRFSCQEYFERMTHDPKVWGKPMSALLGSLKMQMALGLPSIGGKDSMSGTFEHINVPPTLISFGITTVNANNVISPELKWEGNRLWLVKHTPLKNYMPDVEQLKKNWAFVEEQIASGNAVSAWAVGFGGVAEGLCKMSFGNSFGVDVNVPENELFDYNYGSIILETEADLSFENAQFLGTVTSGVDGNIRVNGKNVSMDALVSSAFDRYEKVYPATSTPDMKRLDPKGTEGVKPFKAKKADLKYKGEKIAEPLAFLPVFPGTNCDYDSAKAFRKAGAKVKFGVFRNLTEQDVNDSIEEMKRNIDECQILMLCGGFSAGDEPDGSGKFIANVLNNEKIAAAIEALIARGGLILGICNGFQALVKSGLLPYGHLGCVTKDSPTLFRNDINRHISQIAFTRVASVNSPWLAGMTIGDTYGIPVSHGEGKFVVNEELAKELFDNGQVAFRYAEPIDECVTMHSPYNPNGSYYAIEGIISKNGQILGKMGHSERYENNLFKNIAANLEQPLFDNAVKYFRGE